MELVYYLDMLPLGNHKTNKHYLHQSIMIVRFQILSKFFHMVEKWGTLSNLFKNAKITLMQIQIGAVQERNKID